MGELRFCRYCGTPLNSTANYCPSCGKQVQNNQDRQEQPGQRAAPFKSSDATSQHPVPAPVQAAPSQPQECIHLVLPGANRHSGFLGVKVESFVIVFTNLRIIFAQQTVAMMQENVRRARQDAEQQGKGFFGKWGAQLGANSGKHYWEMPPHQILAEQPTNFAIPREHVRSIRMRQEYSDDDAPDTYQMEFDTVAGKHKFKFGNLNTRELKKHLQQLYGNIVR